MAEEACAADGARVCTQGELEASCGANQGCGMSTLYVWSDQTCDLPDPIDAAKKLAQQLVLASAEFHSSNDNRATDQMRPPRQDVPSQVRKILILTSISPNPH